MEHLHLAAYDDVLVFAIRGEVTLENTEPLKEALTRALNDHAPKDVVFDLSGVDFVDSSGIGFLVAQNTRLKNLGKDMHLYKPSEQVTKTLALVQLKSFFHILEEEVDLSALLPDDATYETS